VRHAFDSVPVDVATRRILPPSVGAVDAAPITQRIDVDGAATVLPPGAGFPRIRGYEIVGIVGCGGMGIVFEARHRALNRRVAIKMLRGSALADPDFRERFRIEAEAIARLQHPNVIQVFEVGTVEAHPSDEHPIPFLALEFVDGGSLDDRTNAPQPPRDAARMVETLARAAHSAHRLGVIHRDLKPSNVLLTRDGAPKIADFGIAKQLGGDPAAVERAVTRAGMVVGTPEYLAPEQLDGGEATPAIDVYSLGVILYELLAARVPFQGATFAETVLLATRREPVPPSNLQPGVPRDLETICLKCLEKTPAKRYESALALADDLAHWLAGRPIQARAVGPVGRTARWAARNPAVAALSVAVCLVALAGLTGIMWGWNESRRNAATADANALDARNAESVARDAEEKERGERYRVSLMAASGALRLHDSNAARGALESSPPAYRDWVWDLLNAQLDRSRAVLRGHGNPLLSARFTSDARWVNLRGRDDTCRLWNIEERREHGPIELKTHPFSAILSEDGAILASGAADGTVQLREVATGRIRTILRGHTASISQIEFSPDGSRLVTVAADGTLRIWDARDGRQLRHFRAPPEAGSPLVISPDHRIVAARGLEGTPDARVWDLETGKQILTLAGHGGCTHFVGFSPTGDRIVTTERFPFTNAYLWDALTGKRIATLRGHQNQVTHTTFSPDGARLATSSTDRTVRVWDASPTPSTPEREALLVLHGHSNWVNHVAFNHDGTRLASSSEDRTIRFWNARTGEKTAVLCGHTGPVLSAAFRRDGTDLVSASADGTVRVWDVAGAENGYAIGGHENFVYQVAYFPDGKRIASAAWDGTARVRDASTGRELMRLDHGADRYVVSVAVHAAGRYVATLARREGVSEMSVRLWDAATGAMLDRWSFPAAWQDGRVAFAPHGDRFAAGDRNGRVRIWDAKDRTEIAVLEGGSSPVREVAFSPDGTKLAAACDDGDNTVRIWDVNGRKEIQILRGHERGVYSLAWNRAGTRLASGSLDHSARIWDTTSWASVAQLNNGTPVYGVAFTADGKLLACACADNLIRFWDAGTGRELAELAGHGNYVHHLAFSPDGTQMVSASGDRTLRVWDSVQGSDRPKR
jgi:eukaryotic-like serine/threonine-protein kinase